MTPRLYRAMLLVTALTCWPGSPARAAIDCTATATGVAFGTYDPLLASPDNSTGSVVVRCTYTAPGTTSVSYTVTLSPGGSGNLAQRQLASGASRLNYGLFRNNARTQNWGDGTSGSLIVSGTFNLATSGANRTRQRTHTVYGRVPQLQDVAPGAYADTIVVTLNF